MDASAIRAETASRRLELLAVAASPAPVPGALLPVLAALLLDSGMMSSKREDRRRALSPVPAGLAPEAVVLSPIAAEMLFKSDMMMMAGVTVMCENL